MSHSPNRLLTLPLLALLATGCVGQIDGYDPAGDDDDTSDTDASIQPGDPDAGTVIPGTPDAAVTPDPPDAYVPPPPPDAAPLAYPAGPYGTSIGSTIANLSWTGYADTDADTDSDPFNESPRTFKLEEYFVGKDAGSRIIVINASAGWCSVCQDEAPSLESFYGSYGSRGLRIVTALFEDDGGSPADTSFAKAWGDYFNLGFPVMADPSDVLSPYYQENSVPMNIFVDASDMTIVDIVHGYDDNYFSQIINSYAD